MRADGWVLAASVLATCALGACEHGDVGPASNFQTLRTCADHGGLSIECRSASGPTVGVASVAPRRSDRGRGARTCRRRNVEETIGAWRTVSRRAACDAAAPERAGQRRNALARAQARGPADGRGRTRGERSEREHRTSSHRHTLRLSRTFAWVKPPAIRSSAHERALRPVSIEGKVQGSPEARDAVLPQDGILGDEDHLSLQSLRDQQAIEGISMMIR